MQQCGVDFPQPAALMHRVQGAAAAPLLLPPPEMTLVLQRLEVQMPTASWHKPQQHSGASCSRSLPALLGACQGLTGF